MFTDESKPAPAKPVAVETTPVRNKTVQLDPDLYDLVSALADGAERTVSKQLNRILRQALKAEITGD